jgi:hypothetical protein
MALSSAIFSAKPFKSLLTLRISRHSLSILSVLSLPLPESCFCVSLHSFFHSVAMGVGRMKGGRMEVNKWLPSFVGMKRKPKKNDRKE